MQPQEYPRRHFETMTSFANELESVPAQIIEHGYNYGTFGSWWTVLQRRGSAFRIVFDGKEQQVRLERAGSGPDVWEVVTLWPAADEGTHALREAVAYLRAV